MPDFKDRLSRFRLSYCLYIAMFLEKKGVHDNRIDSIIQLSPADD